MKKKITASIEARMTSSRLPGKVLMPAYEQISMIEFMVNRVKKSKLVDDIVIATTINKTDDPIIELCKRIKLNYYRGSEEDVLLRVLEAHQQCNSDIIVELSGDCPLIDARIIDEAIQKYLDNNYDYVSNGHLRSFPDGMDVQIFSRDLLESVEKLATTIDDRENVTTYIYRDNDKYSLGSVIAKKEDYWPELRITLDDTGDFLLIQAIINNLFKEKSYDFKLNDIIVFLKKHPHLLDLNKTARINTVESQKIYRPDEGK